MIEPIILFLVPLLISLTASFLIIRFFRVRLLDTPNHRSSHQAPTPRGGGIALACGVIVASLAAWNFGLMHSPAMYWLILLAGFMAFLGACDDLFDLNVFVRLITQCVLAGTGVFLLGVSNEWGREAQFLIAILMILFIVWMTNLYNFMDGINGLAAIEGITVSLSMGLIYWVYTDEIEVVYVLAVIGASTCGFLFWNFPSAKLFMGDSGSLFLGFSFGVLIAGSIAKDFHLVVAWLIVLAVFITDASYTLAYRLLTKQAIHQAHRTHTYQKLAIRLNSHTKTTTCATLINLLWLLPIAISVASSKLNPILAMLIAYTPLLLIAHKIKAGRIQEG